MTTLISATQYSVAWLNRACSTSPIRASCTTVRVAAINRGLATPRRVQ